LPFLSNDLNSLVRPRIPNKPRSLSLDLIISMMSLVVRLGGSGIGSASEGSVAVRMNQVF
jgi:hypothetical protein